MPVWAGLPLIKAGTQFMVAVVAVALKPPLMWGEALCLEVVAERPALARQDQMARLPVAAAAHLMIRPLAWAL